MLQEVSQAGRQILYDLTRCREGGQTGEGNRMHKLPVINRHKISESRG